MSNPEEGTAIASNTEEEDPSQTTLNDLPLPIVRHILESLDDSQDLLNISATSRHLRHAVQDEKLWRNMCIRRWGASTLNTEDFGVVSPTNSVHTDYRQLFLTDNNWRNPTFSTMVYPQELEVDNPAVCSATVSFEHNLVALAIGDGVEILDFSSVNASSSLGPRPSLSLVDMKSARRVYQGPVLSPWQPTALEFLDPPAGIVVGGTMNGNVHVIKAVPSSVDPQEWFRMADGTERQVILASSTPEEDGIRYPITALQFIKPTGQLLVLRDRHESNYETNQLPGRIDVVDAITLQPTLALQDVLHYYELSAMTVPSGEGSEPDSSPFEVITTSVKLSLQRQQGGRCYQCPYAYPGSLCYHQQRSASAALSTFDLRSGVMEQRFALPHRSVYPHIEIVRQHYLLLSHAGSPLTVWDRRFMHKPIHDEPPLSSSYPHVSSNIIQEHFSRCSFMRIPLSSFASYTAEPPPVNIYTQGLHLHANDGLLLGRADDGDCYVWDLSTVLGWEESFKDIHNGSWLRKSNPCSSQNGRCDDNESNSVINPPKAVGRHARPPLRITDVWPPFRRSAPISITPFLPRQDAWICRRGILALLALDEWMLAAIELQPMVSLNL